MRVSTEPLHTTAIGVLESTEMGSEAPDMFWVSLEMVLRASARVTVSSEFASDGVFCN